jgi:aspartyl-tRNA(Asn)/glutamyl-tRNA(Gln) amidotransferase subunit C
MDDRLSKEEVLHVAELARIAISESELEKYQIQLKQIMDSVDKIKEVEVNDEKMLIANWSEPTKLREDVVGEMLNPKEVIGNAPRHSGNYIEVPVVIGEES